MRSPLRTLSLVAAVLYAAVPAAAQVVGTVVSRGWIGVSFEMVTTDQGSGAVRTVVTVTDVIKDGPADKAGVRPGDVVLSVNDHDWQNQFGGIGLRLRPGDPVRMVVERDGRRRELNVTAAPRPNDIAVVAPTWSVTFQADSMVDQLYRAMDSLRIRLIRDDDGALLVVRGQAMADTLSAVIRRVPGAPTRVRGVSPSGAVAISPSERFFTEMTSPQVWTPEVRPPFSFFLFRGEQYDSLRQAMETLNDRIRDVRSEQTERIRELADRSRDGRIDRNDAQLRRLDEALLRLDAQGSELRRAMDDMSRREAGERFGTAWFHAPAPGAAPVVPPSPDPDMADMAYARPLAPYVLGQNRAAGAEVVDLRPELADYFEVTGGVLVVDVPDGTPAALSGIQPGDVIIRVNARDVRSIADLREGIAQTHTDVPITLVRKGKRLQVLLRR